MTYSYRQLGFNLVELMIALAVSAILITGVTTVMSRVSNSAAENIASNRLNQQLRETLDFLSKELQRAGTVNWSSAWDADGDGAFDDVYPVGAPDGEVDIRDFYVATTPAMERFGAVTLWSFPTLGDASSGTPVTCNANCDCVLYSYDLNANGLQGVGAGGTTAADQDDVNFELFGLRWNDGALEVRTSGDTHTCNSGTWEDVTDENVEITTAAFGITYASAVGAGNDSTAYAVAGDGSGSLMGNSCTPVDSDNTEALPLAADTVCLWRRKVDVDIEGRLADLPQVTMTLGTDVKIKNDYYDPN